MTETELDALLSEPTPEVIAALGRIPGDILILGVAGKTGPSLARLAVRGSREAGVSRRVIGVARFVDRQHRKMLDAAGVETVAGDLFDPATLAALPDVSNVIYLVGQKFGTVGQEARTWAINAWLPGAVARRFPVARLVAWSSGNVYPLTPTDGQGPDESGAVGPIGEYAQSVLARERVLEFFSARHETPMAILRLNYAVEYRYGVLRDIADKVLGGEPVDLSMSHVNVIWQRDANAIALMRCAVPPLVLNVTGRPSHAVRDIAIQFARRFGVEPKFAGSPRDTALLSDASRCEAMFGAAPVSIEVIIDGVAEWVKQGGRSLDKPTHFGERTGTF